MDNKEKTACFTGHRAIPASNASIKKRLKKAIKMLIKKGIIYFGAGGALGFDTLAALTILELKKDYPQIRLIMVLPYPEQDRNWNAKDKQVYIYILENADKKVYTSTDYHRACFHVRNRHLVDNASYCIAYLNEHTGGTAYTVDYALKNGVQVINLAEKNRYKSPC